MGFYFMTFDDLMVNFEYCDISLDVSALKHSYYAFFNDVNDVNKKDNVDPEYPD